MVSPRWKEHKDMTSRLLTAGRKLQKGHPHVLRRELGFWRLTFEGEEALFKHELGALYAGCLLLDPPREPIHAVALALKARERFAQADGAGFSPGNPLTMNLGPTDGPLTPSLSPSDGERVPFGRVRRGAGQPIQQRSLGLDDAAAVRALWRRQRELERVLEDDGAIEPVKAEALRELEEVTEFLRKSPWRSRGGAERCVRAVTAAIKRFHAHLAAAVDSEGQPHPVLRAFARHLHEYLLVPSGRGGGYARGWAAAEFPACFTYEPPAGVVWTGKDGVLPQ
jgi:hypothetical protein